MLSTDRFFCAAYVVIQGDLPSVAICRIPLLFVFYFMFYISFLLVLLFLSSIQFTLLLVECSTNN
jgi:hypothetical protein